MGRFGGQPGTHQGPGRAVSSVGRAPAFTRRLSGFESLYRPPTFRWKFQIEDFRLKIWSDRPLASVTRSGLANAERFDILRLLFELRSPRVAADFIALSGVVVQLVAERRPVTEAAGSSPVDPANKQ